MPDNIVPLNRIMRSLGRNYETGPISQRQYATGSYLTQPSKNYQAKRASMITQPSLPKSQSLTHMFGFPDIDDDEKIQPRKTMDFKQLFHAY